MTDQDDREDYPETVEKVSFDVIELHSSARYRNGTNDYSRGIRKIVAIVDPFGANIGTSTFKLHHDSSS